jgi:hypothetical protein
MHKKYFWGSVTHYFYGEIKMLLVGNKMYKAFLLLKLCGTLSIVCIKRKQTNV